jgi:hypothetical protein
MGNSCERNKLEFELATKRFHVLYIPQEIEPKFLLIYKNLTPEEISKVDRLAYILIPPCKAVNKNDYTLNNSPQFINYLNQRFGTDIRICPELCNYTLISHKNNRIELYEKYEQSLDYEYDECKPFYVRCNLQNIEK